MSVDMWWRGPPPSAEGGGLDPPLAKGLEVGADSVGDRDRPSQVRPSQGALIEQGDVRVPSPALRDDTFGVGTEDVTPVGSAPDAEALASVLRGVLTKGDGHTLSKSSRIMSVPDGTSASVRREERAVR